MIRLANKRYAAIVVKDSSGRVLVNTAGQFRVVFSFHAGIDGRPNEGSIRIYGLTTGEEQEIKINGDSVQLIAGSDVRNNLVFSGDLISAFSAEVNQQSYVQLSVVDGDSFFSSFVSLSVGAGESVGGVVEKAVRNCTAPIEIGFIAPSAYNVSLARGVALFGCPIDVIRSAAKSLNATSYVRNGMFYLICAEDKLADPVLLGEDELIGVPVVDNWYSMFKAEMDSGLSVGQFVSFSSEYGLGTYRVVSIDGSGDTRDGDWCLNVTSIAQNNSRPAITAVTSNIWR